MKQWNVMREDTQEWVSDFYNTLDGAQAFCDSLNKWAENRKNISGLSKFPANVRFVVAEQ